MGFLSQELKKKDKKGLLNQNISQIGYPTKLLPLDFRNGYQVNVCDAKTGEIKHRWANVGLFGGSFITVAGKPGVAKTAFCVQVAAEICRNYKESEIYHLDLEGSSNISRMMKLANYSYKEMENKFNYFNDYHYIEDIFQLICNIADTKCTNKEIFSTKTGVYDEFGREEEQLVPTVVIIDSIPMLVTKDLEGEMNMAGMTYDGRRARVISQFYRRLRPVLQRANIIVMAINHINAKIDINPMAKSQSQIMYLKQDEATPGGNAPLYLAQTFLKFVQCGKFTDETDGFNGFKVRCELIKSKTNRGGSSCILVYDMETGFDPYRTILEHIKEQGLLEGRNPKSYFRSNPELKFDSRNFSKLCRANPELFKEAMLCAAPSLYGYLANAEDLNYLEEKDTEVLKRLESSNKLEESLNTKAIIEVEDDV